VAKVLEGDAVLPLPRERAAEARRLADALEAKGRFSPDRQLARGRLLERPEVGVVGDEGHEARNGDLRSEAEE